MEITNETTVFRTDQQMQQRPLRDRPLPHQAQAGAVHIHQRGAEKHYQPGLPHLPLLGAGGSHPGGARMKCPTCNNPLLPEHDRIKCVVCGYSKWDNFTVRKPGASEKINLGGKHGRNQ
jgi:hypothetical protein